MLRVVAHKSAAAAKAYYTEGLKREDYYSEKQKVVGKWHGLSAELLGLSGDVTAKVFAALADNRHPVSGEKLTPRTKMERRVGYDINFHAPKSLSILYALTGDKSILAAFRSSVADAMAGIEAQTMTRIRRHGEEGERSTGNLVWAEFVHFTARPVGGIPDPHLHAHCFAFNSTFDPIENRWKAASWARIKKDAPYSEAVFHSLLTDRLAALGYPIERTRGGWEVAGISREVIDKFSRRTEQIERLAAEAGITDAKAKDALGAASREGKRRGLTNADLRAAWTARLTGGEKAAISAVASKSKFPGAAKRITAEQALDEACEKLFAKHSVADARRVMAEALRFGVGFVTPREIEAALKQRGMVLREVEGQTLCTSLNVLAEEVALINFVRTGRDKHAPFSAGEIQFGDSRLSAEQQSAVRHLLTSQDQVMAVRGGAGVGKTTLMQEAVAQIEKTGIKVFVFAPSASASRGTLREAGFADAETVARLLTDTDLQMRTHGHVIWVDEAGLLGVRDMWKLMQIAGNDTRLLLTGDTAQHAPVARGDALRLMQEYAGLPVAEVKRIRRQDGAIYRKAVAALSKGDLATGFRRLDELGAFIEIENDAERYRLLAHDFLRLSGKDTVPLVVSPTHAEAAQATAAIREAKREAGWLGPERQFIQFHNLQWEETDRRRPENYAPGQVVQFHQNATGICRGEIFRITGQHDLGAVSMVSESGKATALPLNEAAKFQVFEEREISLARGDRLRITRNGKSEDGRRLHNGNLFTVEKLTRGGKIVLDSGAVIDARKGAHIAFGYVTTSHSAQSKTVRDVLVAQSEASFSAGSLEQFYVSVSRAQSSIRIYTDSRKGLQDAVGNSSKRQAGIELAGLNAREINSFMATELDARQWREHIHSRRGEGDAKTHVQNLLKERKQEGLKKPENLDFRQYLEVRRGMTGADGKSRSKGHPSGDDHKKSAVQNRGRSFLRPTQPRVTPKEQIVADENKIQAAAKSVVKFPVEPLSRLSRVAKGISAAHQHFAKVSEKVKGAFGGNGGEKRPNQLPQATLMQSAQHSVKQKAAIAASGAKVKVKAPIKAPAPVMVKKGK